MVVLSVVRDVPAAVPGAVDVSRAKTARVIWVVNLVG
jgi:hypothetical protein